MGDDRVRITQDGGWSFSPPTLKARFAAQPGEYRVHEGPSGAWLLMRSSDGKMDQSRTPGRVLMMGELVHRMTVVEIINLVMSSNWRGDLHLVGPTGRRVLTVDQGALKYARTDFEHERLGEVLVRSGVIERATLTRVLSQKTESRRFGQRLVELGLLAQEVLFKQLQQQAEIIFNGALLEDRGLYWFVAPPEDAEAPSATVHLSIQSLLMEGVQQIDEMGLFRERIPHNGLYPTIIANAPGNKANALDAASLEVLLLCDGTRNVDDLARARGGGEFPTLKAIYNLLRAGQVQLRRGPRLDPKTAQRLVRQFNELIRDVFMVVATYGRMESTRRTLSAWLAESPHAGVLGTDLDIDGTLDANHVIGLLESGNNDDPMTALHRALHELMAYALFTAAAGLPLREEQALARDVNLRLKALRL